ncbi:MAG: A/G-specific adenine glycosylase [Planctomycetota bacterium]|nr:MAG: A/G-specific adenine glycosylase [Planctomycetota bacterium]REJ89206.1 MAG: A/G-specific adenine glycosylase [Planctomycetota bacterium]REK21305.1 MAG: A/G-specific adenine glycosylase [Planctomycetota bacterium]REK32101.1 MAG: A/G-specific adenine glycosylase [Planctomycetota bacterium]
MDAAWLRRFRRNLLKWYASNARDLPWRSTREPYHVWISEIMLQQTTVAAVVPYYQRFLDRFPSVRELAAAEESEVLRFWEGLGYYSRARNIHRAARHLVDKHDGRFPTDVETLQTLPGIGRYTAGAVASFAFDRPAPIVEANTLRLYSRLLGFDGDPRSSAGQRLLWSFAQQILPQSSPGRLNQALIELGATLCTPADPACSVCPVRTLCRACAEGRQTQIPVPAKRPEITEVIEASLAVQKNGRYLLRQRGEQERWAGLWDFPRFEIDGAINGAPTAKQRRDLAQQLAQCTGIEAELGDVLTEIRHGVTRYRIRLLCLKAVHRGGRLHRRNGPQQWVRPGDFADFPLSVTGRKLAQILADAL